MSSHCVMLGRAFVIAGLIAGVAGCGSSSSGAPKVAPSSTSTPVGAPTTAAHGDSTITIKNLMFGAPITVKAGSTVTVKNDDDTTHSLAADTASFGTGNIFAGAAATFIAPSAGSYPFHCNIHANMHGVLNVVA